MVMIILMASTMVFMHFTSAIAMVIFFMTFTVVFVHYFKTFHFLFFEFSSSWLIANIIVIIA
ncbi:hypothetical protein [Rossellomorea aquimaris]|uniref:hypothetical protein n=1 Tax=Rossellomorea aquimaris TaxID=189382 RepID=UPI0005C978ED|nr:hypothetical protein [Rossellomorea aquimaris]